MKKNKNKYVTIHTKGQPGKTRSSTGQKPGSFQNIFFNILLRTKSLFSYSFDRGIFPFKELVVLQTQMMINWYILKISNYA